jgi:hypothetical protein
MGHKKYNQKLLVEGSDDQHVIWALCEKFNLKENFEVIDCKGISKLEEQISIRFKESGIRTVGLIIDADTNLQARWEQIKTQVKDLGFILDSLPKEGLIIENNKSQKLGVWIMPDNNLSGMLEDFIAFLVPKDDKLLPLAKEKLEDLEQQGLNKYKSIHHSKALIHTWLAWQEDPGTPIGLSITKRYLETDNDVSKTFISWLIKLFE